jgi:small subunit ribosomal protein S2
MADEVLKKLLECGVHFGHQTRRWNPKMKKFIFGERSGIYIIDLEKTIEYLNMACDFAKMIAAKGGVILFVGTKKQAKDVIEAEAKRAGMPYINNRWMGGLLTNFQTVRKSIEKLLRLEKMIEDGVLKNLKKKEVSHILKEKDNLLRDLGGIRDMRALPQAIFVVDTKREDIAIREASKLAMPIIGLLDTNCDPELIDYPVPGNDDALKSIRYITSLITDNILEGRKLYLETEAVKAKTIVATDAAPSASSAPGVVESSQGSASLREVTSIAVEESDSDDSQGETKV